MSLWGCAAAQRVRTEQISLKNLLARFEQARDTLFQGLGGFLLHVDNLRAKRKFSRADVRYHTGDIRKIWELRAKFKCCGHLEL